MALDLPLPLNILTHAHWTLGKEKMSKSTGNVVNPFFALDRFGVDVMRFYLVHDGGIADDAGYTNDNILERYRVNLQGQLGNLTSRLVRGKGWNLKTAVQEASNKDWPKDLLSKADDNQWLELTYLEETFRAHMKTYDVGRAVKSVLRLIRKVQPPPQT